MSKKSKTVAVMNQPTKASVSKRSASGQSKPTKAPAGILVLGMHRSGTSAITRVLNLLGVELGSKLMPAQPGVNDKGFWEHVDAVAIHERLLRWHDSNWSGIRKLPEIDLRHGVGQQALADARELIRRDFGHSSLWAIKDPRMSLFVPVWLQAMSAEHVQPKFIISVRHPEEVAASLRKRDGLTRGHAHLLWGHHVVEALKGSRGFPRAVSDYAGLLKNWRKQTDSIAAALGITWPEAGEAATSVVNQFLSDDDRHHRQSSANLLTEDPVERRVHEMYSCLVRIAEGHDGWSKLEEASMQFQEVSSALVPHLSELLEHVWMHADRAGHAEARHAEALLEVARINERSGGPTAGSVVVPRAELESRLHALESEAGVLHNELRARDGRMDALQQVVAEKEQRLVAASEQTRQQQGLLSELRTHVDALTDLRGELESRLHALESEAGVLHSELRARDGRMDALQQVVAEKEQRLVAASEQTRQQQGLLSELRAHADALTGLRGELESRLHALESEAGVLHSELRARDGRMDALQQVVMEKEQRLVAASEQQQQQQGLLSELRAHADALTGLRGELESRLHARESEADALRHELNARESRLSVLQVINSEQENLLAEARLESETLRLELDSERKGRRETMEELNNTADELGQRLSQIEIQLADTRHALHRRELKLQDVSSELELRRTELTRILHSNSWKLSAPLRWLRNRIDAIRRGQSPASYKQLLEAPMTFDSYRFDEPTVDAIPVEPTALSVASSPMQKTYLDALFAHELSSPAPEFKEYADAAAPDADSLRAKLIAFYLPQFHPFAENDEWWGKGFTEWTNVTKALPQFLGHYQPHLPADLGFYDLRLPEVIRQQVELARQYGIHGFCFHYYWFEGRRLLEKPLELFVENKDIDFPFCLCWANENWTRRWDGQESEILMSQEHSPENDLAFIRDLIPHLQDPRYIKIDGRPLVIVYRPSILPDCASTLRRWREYCRETGIGEIFLGMVQFDVQDPGTYGFDAAIEFPPHKLASGFDAINNVLDIVNPDYQGHVVHYQSIVESAKAWPTPGYPLVRGVFPGWDNEARRPGKGYTFAFATPDRYKEWLGAAVDYAESNPIAGERLVMINAWNEWAEGAHLEPDRRYGHAFLQATREVVEGPAACLGHEKIAGRRPRIVVVSHDAHPHGAQYLTLNIVKELDEVFGFDVDLVLLGEGRLTANFAQHAKTHNAASISGDEGELLALARRLRAGGAAAAITSTTVAGVFAGALKNAGMHVVSLVHEMPGLIKNYGLERHAQSIASNADHIVFAAPQVLEGFSRVVGHPLDRAMIRPQGLFTRSRYLGQRDLGAARDALRDRLGIPRDSRIVLAVGYGDHRKGLDIFGDVARELCGLDPSLNFVWVGHYDQRLMADVKRRLMEVDVLDRFHAAGLDFDTDDYYAGADVYALTSREDPFPSVVLESLAVGLPVVAFAGTGGAEQLLVKGCGRLVGDISASAFANAVDNLLQDPVARATCAELGRSIIAREYGFTKYVFDLLAMAGVAPPRVSVIVPNYNYANLLRLRLDSIAAQQLPPYEVIVLDDCSTDASLDVLADLRAELSMDFEVVPGEKNSGSVFKQWLKGVERAKGEYIWIAEADDLSAPEFLATVVAALEGNESIHMSYCQSSAIDANGDTLTDDYLAYTDDLSADRWLESYNASGEQEVHAGLAVKNTIPNVSAVVFRRNELLRVLGEGIDKISHYRVAGDWVTYLMLLKNGRIAYSPRVLNHHRRHQGGVTIGSNQLALLQEVLKVQQYARENYPVNAGCVERASRYAQVLYEQFGFVDEVAPSIEMNAHLRDFVARAATQAASAPQGGANR